MSLLPSPEFLLLCSGRGVSSSIRDLLGEKIDDLLLGCLCITMAMEFRRSSLCFFQKETVENGIIMLIFRLVELLYGEGKKVF